MTDGTKFVVLTVSPMGAEKVDFWVKAEGGPEAKAICEQIGKLKRGQQVAVQAGLAVRDNGTIKYKFQRLVSVEGVADIVLVEKAAA